MSAETGIRGLRWLRRIARIVTLLILAVTLVVVVGHLFGSEPIEEDYPPIENLLPILMALSVVGLGIALRWEGLGATISLGFFVAHMALFWAIRGEFFPFGMLIVFTPLPLTAVLFLICWWRSRTHSKAQVT
jgi:hypothetical protein